MTCEKCRLRPGILWQPVRSPEGWTVTRIICPECAGLRPKRQKWLLKELGWALFIVVGALAAAPVILYIWEIIK